jgi:negative regulator of flagellin synthesis FlgM
MRIDSDPNRIGALSLSDRVSPQRGAPAAQGTRLAHASGPDEAVLSQRAQEVLAARKALAAIPDVRAEKVAELRQKISSGTYEVDAEAVARKILEGGL